MENVKSFTRTNINKPNFTPRKVRKSRHFWHFKPTKQNLWGFLWWINVDKLSSYGSLSIDLKFFAHIFPKMACYCQLYWPPKLFTPTGHFFYTDLSVISVTFSISALRGRGIGYFKNYIFVQTIKILWRKNLVIRQNTWNFARSSRAVLDILQSPSATLDHYDENLSTKDMLDWLY